MPRVLLTLPTALVKRGVAGVKILGVEGVLGDAEGVGKSLIMHQFSLAQELDGVADVGVIHKAEDVIVGHASLLLC